MSVTMEFTGFDEVNRKLRELPEKAEAAIGGALWQVAMDVQRTASTKIPVDTGTLRRSWVVGAPKKNGGAIYVIVGYGTHYAIFVHERTDLSHSVGQAKFLEAALKEESGVFRDKLAKRTLKILESSSVGLAPRETSGDKYAGGVN